MNKKISVILPVYNGEKRVSRAIESVLNQTYQNFELIIVNDCSSDGTMEVLSKYDSEDSRIKVVNNETNQKLPKSLNIGFFHATGDYLTWTSDNSTYKPDAFMTMTKYLDKHGDIDLVYCDFDVVDLDGNYKSTTRLPEPDKMKYENVVGACFLYRKELADMIGDYDPELFLAEDYEYWIKAYINGNLYHIPEVLYDYGWRDESLTVMKKTEVFYKTYEARNKHFKQLLSKCETQDEKNEFYQRMLGLLLDVREEASVRKKYYKQDKLFMYADLKKRINDGMKLKRESFILSMIVTFFWGFLAYGYAFVNFTPSHDGIMTVTYDQNWQIALGRIWAPSYVWRVRGLVCSPWLIGILTLFYLGCVTYLITDILAINSKRWAILIIGSLLVLNISNTLLATVFIHTLDIYTLSLLLAVMSVWTFLKCKNMILSVIISALFLAFSLGLYQSYFAVVVALFVIMLMKKIINEEDTVNQLLVFAASELSALALGSGLYYISMKVIQKMANVTSVSSYNSVGNLFNLSPEKIISLIPACYREFLLFFFGNKPYASKVPEIVNVIFFVIAIASYTYCLGKMKNYINRILLMALLVIFPLAANCIYILSSGKMHYLMVLSYQMLYIVVLLPILTGKFSVADFLTSRLTVTLVLILSFIVIRFSNDIMYYQKLVGDGTEASMTNILYDIERCPDFDPENMNIVMIGDPASALAQKYVMTDVYGKYTGIGNGTTITYGSVFGLYLRNILGREYTFEYSESTVKEIEATEEYNKMPIYPKEGYIKPIDGYLVIKFN